MAIPHPAHLLPILLENKKGHPLFQLFALDKEYQMSALCDQSRIQDSFCCRMLSRARKMAEFLIDDRGGILSTQLKTLTQWLETEGFCFSIEGFNDGLMTEHFLRVLYALQEKEIYARLQRFQVPLCHRFAEKLILETLGHHASERALTDVDVRRAVLVSSFTLLRQTVGSCFATAPAIFIQKEQYPLFLDDLYQLLSTGKLKRTFEGIEYVVPLSPNTGIGDLKKKILPEYACLSPGLHSALESIELFSSASPLSEKIAKTQALLQRAFPTTVEQFFQSILLERFDLSEKDLLQQKHLEKAQMQKSGGFVTPAPMLGKIHAFRDLLSRAKGSFSGFCDNALLKAWEFTLASFSEAKMEFSKWNLYTSLGIPSEEVGGIGQLIYRYLNERIEECNKKIDLHQKEYEVAFDQVRSTEVLFRNVSSEAEARRLTAEHQSRLFHMHACRKIRDDAYQAASYFAELYPFLLKQFGQRFPEYFQEIYDAQMHEFSEELYADSPAGFRLVYKHGRADPTLWTLIEDEEQYIEALADFFMMTEASMIAACEWEGSKVALEEILSAIIVHVRSPQFLSTALERITKAHSMLRIASPLYAHFPLATKPWAYISGGTVETLLKVYCCREAPFTVEERWMESETDLLIFLLDAMKGLSPRLSDPFIQSPWRGMLCASPTHVFLFLPGQVQEGWKEEMFTYTWVRDAVFLPSKHFYESIRLNAEEQRFLLEQLSQSLPLQLGQTLQSRFYAAPEGLSIVEFRSQVLVFMEGEASLYQDLIDAYLYQTLPLVPRAEWKVMVRHLLSDLYTEAVDKVLSSIPEISAPFFSAKEMKEAAKACYLLAHGSLLTSFDLHQYIAKHARFIGLSAPSSLLVADTNWAQNFFGFVVNPGNNRLELWRVDRTLSQGAPMSSWKHWLNGTDKKSWTLYTTPYEYTHKQI